MKVTDDEILLIKILTVGGFASVGKLLSGNEALTVRKLIGRAITGATSAIACFAIFLRNESVSELAVIGLAALIGILGSSTIEYFIVTFFDSKIAKTEHKQQNNKENKDD